jgi:nitrilase
MTGFGTVTLAAIRAAPRWFDKEASTTKACSLIADAGAMGVQLAAFGEAWFPAAREAGIDVLVGVAELDTTTLGTCYCTPLFIGSSGEILSRHRKLKPTGAERTVWGKGDGVGLTVH